VLDEPSLDNTHIEFIELANLADQANDFPLLFDTLVEHTHKHFEQEGRLMTESGFLVIAEHRDEHQRILGELESFANASTGAGGFRPKLYYISGRVAEWFPLHAATLDSPLAVHLKSASNTCG
jgi:hemerythrin-like metal-binding protein